MHLDTENLLTLGVGLNLAVTLGKMLLKGKKSKERLAKLEQTAQQLMAVAQLLSEEQQPKSRAKASKDQSWRAFIYRS